MISCLVVLEKSFDIAISFEDSDDL